MDRFIAIMVQDENKAYECVRALEELHNEGSVTVYATAVLQRLGNGTLSLKQQSDDGPVGTALGSLIGMLIGLAAGPAGVVAGAASGGIIGAWGQYGVHAEISDEFADDLTKTLRPGDFAVLAEVQEEWTAPIDTRIEKLGGKIVRESRTAYVEDLMHKRVDADKTALQKFKTDRESAKAERMQSDLEHEIQTAAEKLRRRADKAQTRLDHQKEEMNAKVKRLEDQASQAKPEVKNRIQQRIADIRRDFSERSGKLQRAYELTQEALGA